MKIQYSVASSQLSVKPRRRHRQRCMLLRNLHHKTPALKRRGSTPANHPLSLNLLLPIAPSFALSALLIVCALPVLPAKSMPCKCDSAAVPPGFTTFAIASVMISQFLGSIETLTSSDGVEAGITFGGRSVGLVICGRRSTPPLAIAPIARASWMGVTATAPCPIPTEIVSPAYHFCLKLRIFHCSEGMTPLTSCGRSTPVFCPNPNIVAYLAMRSIPNFSASV